MNPIKRAVLALVLTAGITPAFAQVPQYPQTMPFDTFVGRIQPGSGPSSAIPIASLLARVATPNSISNSILFKAGAATLKGNPTSATANVQDFTIQGLIARGAPDANNDKLLIFDNATGLFKYVTPGLIASAATSGVSSFGGLTGALVVGGGLTCSSLTCNTGPGVDTNASSATKVANYTATSADCGAPIVTGGNASFTVTLGAASGFPANCVITIANTDAWGSGRGKQLAITGTTPAPDILYPTMLVKFRNIGNVWFQEPAFQRVLVPTGTKMYADVVNGNDANDCLAAGSGNACATLGHLFNQAYLYFHVRAGSATPNNPGLDFRLANNPSCNTSTGVGCHSGLHMSGMIPGTEGHNAVMVECDGGSPANCTIGDSANCAIGTFNAGVSLALKNVTLAGITNCDIEAADGSTVRIQASVILLSAGANAAMLQADTGGKIILDNGSMLTINGNAAWLGFANNLSSIVMDTGGVSFSANASFSQQTFGCSQLGLISLNTVNFNLNAHTVTGQRFSATTNCVINTSTGSVGAVPGSVAGTPATPSSLGEFN